jgi:hypothetical protein
MCPVQYGVTKQRHWEPARGMTEENKQDIQNTDEPTPDPSPQENPLLPKITFEKDSVELSETDRGNAWELSAGGDD